MDGTRFLKFSFFTVFLSVIVFGSFLPKMVFASTSDGTISGYAWSSQIGWINFGTAGGNTHITDTAMTGYAWNENIGWITLAAATSGVKNDGNGTLSGKAWSPGTGWINFTGVTVSSSGVFSGNATGDNNVNINFNCTKCNVTTDWRPSTSRSATASSGGGGGGGKAFYSSPSPPFVFLINNASNYTNNRFVTLSLKAGTDAVAMAIANTADFSDAIQEPYQTTKAWTLIQGDGAKTVYVKFYTNYGVASEPISASIILDTQAPFIKITSLKNSYGSDQEVIIGGTTENDAQINLSVDNGLGIFNADGQGNWLIDLGRMSLGQHHAEFTAKDLAGNIGETIRADFSVVQVGQNKNKSPFVLAPPLAPILRQLAQGINALLPKPLQPLKTAPQFTLAPPSSPILRQLEQGINNLVPNLFNPIARGPVPTPVAIIPKIAPLALRATFNYIPTSALTTFVLAPLPSDLKLLAQKFPKVQKIFNQVGIQKITDVQKLTNVNLTLPTLTETLFPQVAITTGSLAAIKGISVENLSISDKSRIPSEVVFAKTAGGLVDLSATLSLNNQGQAEQTIETVAGSFLRLVVRVNRPVKRIIGYIVFKSKNYHETSYKMPLQNATASLLFSNPTLTAAVTPSVPIQIEGNTSSLLQVNVVSPPPDLQSAENVSNIEQRLVLATFEYQNSGNGVYTAMVQAPLVDAEYEIITQMDYLDPQIAAKEIKLTTVVDPEGYVYEKNGNLETRILGSVVSLYWLNPQTSKYELWPAKDYQQQNPQTTDVRGSYSFLVPNGYYYLQVDAPGYLSYNGKPFLVTEGSGIHTNIELKTQYWWLNVVDWKTLLLVAVILLLFYNFYKDKMREKNKIIK